MKEEVPPTARMRGRYLAFVLPPVLTLGLFLGLIFVVILPTMKRHMMELKKETLRELTQTAWSDLAALHAQEVAGSLTRAEAQQAAISRIRELRYGDERKDYFWLFDETPRMIMHPYRPEMEGQDLRDYADPAGKRLFVKFVEVSAIRGEGYVDYLWQWQDDEERVVPKLSYVKRFEPWDWLIGTGIYVEDVRGQIREITRQVMQIAMGILVVMAGLLAYVVRHGFELDRRRALAVAALRESEEKYRLLVQGTTEGVLMVLQERPVYANQTLLSRLGYTEEELADLTMDRILEPLSEEHALLIAKNGTTSEVQLASAPVRIGERTGQVLSLKDVTAHRQSEETVARLLAELQTTLPLTTRPVKASPLSTVSCELHTPIRQAAAAMARAKASAILVKGPDGQPIGIVTDSDLRNRVLSVGRDAGEAVAGIMSAPLVRIAEHALLFEAARLMQERGVQHLVVTDERGTAQGLLSGTEILHAQSHAIGLLLNEIEHGKSVEELRACRGKLPLLVKTLLDSGTRIEHVTRIMSSVADAITVRLLAMAEAELGQPPAVYSFLALGSEARGEQTLATDQDNALVYADVPAEDAEAVQGYFLRLGEAVCSGLERVGYRRCQGETMASNPKWCQPLSRWREYFTECVLAAEPQELLDVNIFFDLRCVHGDATHVNDLRQHWQALLAPDRPVFLFHLAQSTLQFRPPRGFFGSIQLESGGEHADAFNIKSAVIPLVNFARIYALQHHLVETNTLERLGRLRDLGVLIPSSHDELSQAYSVLMQMRLTHQSEQVARGEAADNYLRLDELTQLERSMLKKVFADITVFQARLRTDFARTT